jgi:hypothetical protein
VGIRLLRRGVSMKASLVRGTTGTRAREAPPGLTRQGSPWRPPPGGS